MIIDIAEEYRINRISFLAHHLFYVYVPTPSTDGSIWYTQPMSVADCPGSIGITTRMYANQP